MDPITTQATLEEQGLRLFTYGELKSVGLHALMTEVTRIGHTETDLLTAPPAALAGLLYAAQVHDPEIVLNLNAHIRKLSIRAQDRAIKEGPSGSEQKKPRERSKVGGAVARVWEVCEKNPGMDRKAVIAKCVEMGINENTAKTQYAQWRKSNAGK